jgi:hypothetical protein
MSAEAQIEELRAALNAATEGPWCHYPEAGWIEIGNGNDEAESTLIIAGHILPINGWDRPYETDDEPNAEFIVLARNNLAVVLAAYDERGRQNSEVRCAHADMVEQIIYLANDADTPPEIEDRLREMAGSWKWDEATALTTTPEKPEGEKL